MQAVLLWLQGKKTYFVAVATICGAIAGLASQTIEPAEALNLIVIALLGLTGRAAIEKVG